MRGRVLTPPPVGIRFVRDDGGSEGNEAAPRFTDLPEAVQRLADTMLGIDSEWRFEDWLQAKAEADIEILQLDIDRARLQTEQKLFRIESLSQRLDQPEPVEKEGAQKNLFDCFDIVERGLANAKKGVPHVNENDSEPHPASYLASLLPGEESDDPLLAITAQSILIEISQIIANGADFAPLEDLARPLLDRDFSEAEIEEALDYLLLQGEIHEVEDNCFITD